MPHVIVQPVRNRSGTIVVVCNKIVALCPKWSGRLLTYLSGMLQALLKPSTVKTTLFQQVLASFRVSNYYRKVMALHLQELSNTHNILKGFIKYIPQG